MVWQGGKGGGALSVKESARSVNRNATLQLNGGAGQCGKLGSSTGDGAVRGAPRARKQQTKPAPAGARIEDA